MASPEVKQTILSYVVYFKKNMLVSTFEVLVKSQLPPVPNPPPALVNLNRRVIQGYFLTIANVNFFPVTISVVFTANFTPGGNPVNFATFLTAVDIAGINLIPPAPGAPRLIPEVLGNKARITFTIPANTTGLLILQPDILQPAVLAAANFEARGYVEIFLSSLSGSTNEATLIVTPEQRGTFYKDLNVVPPADAGLDQIAYSLPVRNGGVFKLSND
jgi:hypothetical protein